MTSLPFIYCLEYNQSKVENLKLRSTLQSLSKAKEPTPPFPSSISLLVSTITAPRRGANYLQEIFPTAHLQWSTALRPHLIRTLTVNTRPGQHPEFHLLRERYSSSQHQFVEVSSAASPRNQSEQDGSKLFGGSIKPAEVRLNHDLLEFLRVTMDHCSSESLEFVALMEDDFEWCPGALLHLLSAIQLAETRTLGKWLAVRTSVGLNGVLLHCQDLSMLLRVGRQKSEEVPLDSLFGGIWSQAKEAFGREYLIYRYNLFSHVGKISAKGGEHRVSPDEGALFTGTPACFDLIRYVGLFPSEYFQEACLSHPFSPCT